ncbi:MAG: glycosyltransferase [Actinobacteria bacterium]|nr:MAG: glycosyltransferase [Actinomycetota bacterium]
MAPRISVVIPTLARHDRLALALDRLEGQAGGHELEVVVVEDADAVEGNRVSAAIAGRPYAVRSLRATLAGASAARNVGWRAVEADLILFIGDDILASPHLVDEHLAWHHRHAAPEIGVLGHVHWAREPRPTTFMRWLERGIQTDYGSIKGQQAGWWHLYTTNVSLKRGMLERVDGFDESQPFLYEDLDLGKRMAEHGFSLLYNADAWAEHLHPTTLDDWRRRMAMVARAEHRFVARHPELEPYFHRMFSEAAEAPRARGLAARLAPLVPQDTPRLGRRVWESVDRKYRQALAPDFLRAWDEAAAELRYELPGRS